ncbi:MAG: hypothetical protein JNM78_14575 [Cyclobacteriaceae bacterium]|nr:hypothetical protein [Cyclobacteriaceae bacterium]
MNFVRVFVNLFQFNRTNWKAVALCFIAAAIFWIFNSFNKKYAANIRFPLRFDYAQDKYIPLTALPNEVSLNVSGNGWDLFRKSIGFKLPELRIVLQRPTDVKKIVASSLMPSFSEQVGNALQINYIINDTLRLQIEELDTHKYKLVADLSHISFPEGYGRISPVVILPDSVRLQGAKSLLHQLSDSIILVLPNATLSERLHKEIEISIPNADAIEKKPKVASVMFEVGPMSLFEFYASVEVLHSSAKVSIADSVRVNVRIPKFQEEKFKAEKPLMLAVVDLKNKPKGTYHLRPKLKGLAPYMEVLSIDSVLVKQY